MYHLEVIRTMLCRPPWPVSMAVVGMIYLINSRNVRFGVASVLVLLAVLTHYTASLRVLHEEEVIANFWQQVVWRAPGIKAGTTLVVNYPSVNYAEDVDAVAGPANFIYFPEQTNQIPAVYQLVCTSTNGLHHQGCTWWWQQILWLSNSCWRD